LHSSLAPILKKEDGLVDFSRRATEIYNRLRGFQPWPGAYTKFRGKNLQLHKVKPLESSVAPAELSIADNVMIVGCGHNTSLELLELQLEGKKRTTAKHFLQGYRAKAREKLGM
jgi:methionyl-tRNA formyltransferase